MNVKNHFLSQYRASLTMLKNAITSGNSEIWDDASYTNRFWHVAYHTLFYADLYLSKDEKSFVFWEKHQEEYEFLGPLPWPPHNKPKIGKAYSQQEVLEYWGHIQQSLECSFGVNVISKMDRIV